MAFLACCGGSPAFAQNAGFERHYFKQFVQLKLDPNRLAVQGLNAAGVNVAATAYSVHPGDFQYPMADWTLLRSDAGQAKAAVGGGEVQAVTTAVGEVSKAGQVAFVSPVFVDDFGMPIVVTRDLLVAVRADIPIAQARQIVSAYGTVVDEGLAGLPNGFKVRSASRDGVEVLRQSNELAVKDEIVFAEPDFILTGTDGVTPNDPLFRYCWGLQNTGQQYFDGTNLYVGTPGMDMGAVSAWDSTTGSSAIVTVVIDNGVQSSHPDLSGRILTPGYDATGQNGAGEPVLPCDRHGTSVAGCIVAKLNNNLGVVGVAPTTRVASARNGIANPSCDGTFTTQASWTANCIGWAQSIGARITNTSQIFRTQPATMTAAYENGYAAGLLHFACSGNDFAGAITYPASIPVVNSVGSIDPSGVRSDFSNYGPGLDFVAPGLAVYTTDLTGAAGYESDDYQLAVGTSYASPYAAGVAALILSEKPSLPPSQVEQIMRETARDLGTAGYDTDYGYGLVRADEAMKKVNGTCPDSWELQTPGPGLTATRSGAGMVYDTYGNRLVLVGGTQNDGSTLARDSAGNWTTLGVLPSKPDGFGIAFAYGYDAANPTVGKVIVTGGYNSTTGWQGNTYELIGTNWVLTSTTGPSKRYYGAMAYDANAKRAVYFGGGFAGTLYNDTWLYNPLTSTWQQATPAHSPPVTSNQVMAYDPVRKTVVLFGGGGYSGDYPDTWEWTGSDWVKITTATSPPGRSSGVMTFDPALGKMVMFGGYGGGYLSDTWVYTGPTPPVQPGAVGTWTQLQLSCPASRYAHVMAYDPTQQGSVMCGGASPTGGLTDIWEFNGAAWVPLGGATPAARIASSMVYAPELGGALMFGGQTAVVGGYLNEAWVRSPISWGQITPPLNGLTARSRFAMVYDSVSPTKAIYLFGGIGNSGTPLNDTWRLVNGAWQPVATTGTPPGTSEAASCFFASQGRFVVVGGRDPSLQRTDNQYSLATGSSTAWQQFTGPRPSARSGAMMAYDPVRDEAVLFGGRDPSGAMRNDYWVLKYVSGVPQWTFAGTLGSFSGLQSWADGAMFWDPGRQRILLYGKDQAGIDPGSATFPVVYEWLGSSGFGESWARVDVNGGPALRQLEMLAPTSPSGDIRMFGGLTYPGSTVLSDNWVYNGASAPLFAGGDEFTQSLGCISSCTMRAGDIVGKTPVLQWTRDDVAINDGPTSSGSVYNGTTTSTLNINGLTHADEGVYRLVATNACGTASNLSFVVQFPCSYIGNVADFDGSGGTPDAGDVDAFFTDWLAGSPCADADQSGGTPDASDVDTFFAEWLAGGC